MKIELPWPIVLASGSPRRRELLASIVSDFSVEVLSVDESLDDSEDVESATRRLAFAKGEAVRHRFPECLVIAADTLVGLSSDSKTYRLGKPLNISHSEEMLALLSGKTHFVVTGVALLGPKTRIVFSEKTLISFRDLSAQEIAEYVSTGETMDKAGSYAIQGGAQGFVNGVKGSLTNVIGLPLERLRSEFTKLLSEC
jgi:septum formation protein